MPGYAVILVGIATIGLGHTLSHAQPVTLTSLNAEESALLDEHVLLGLPTIEPILIRKGYVALYDPYRRDPLWVAYHVVPEYRDTPPREREIRVISNGFRCTEPR